MAQGQEIWTRLILESRPERGLHQHYLPTSPLLPGHLGGVILLTDTFMKALMMMISTWIPGLGSAL